MNIHYEALRQALLDECMAAGFGAGIGTAFIDASDVEDASEEELIELAQQYGIDVSDYEYL